MDIGINIGLMIAFILPAFLGMVIVAIRLRGWIRTAAMLLSPLVPIVGLIAFIGCFFVPPDNPEKPWALDRVGGNWLFAVILFFALVTTLWMAIATNVVSIYAPAQNQILFAVWAIGALTTVIVSGVLIARLESSRR